MKDWIKKKMEKGVEAMNTAPLRITYWIIILPLL